MRGDINSQTREVMGVEIAGKEKEEGSIEEIVGGGRKEEEMAKAN